VFQIEEVRSQGIRSFLKNQVSVIWHTIDYVSHYKGSSVHHHF